MGISDNKVPYQCHSLYFTLIETLLPIIECDVSRKYTKGRGQKRRISSIYALNFETKSILSDRAWVDLESLGIFFCVFLCFGYKITEKPRNPSDNLVHASIELVAYFGFVLVQKHTSGPFWSDGRYKKLVLKYWLLVQLPGIEGADRGVGLYLLPSLTSPLSPSSLLERCALCAHKIFLFIPPSLFSSILPPPAPSSPSSLPLFSLLPPPLLPPPSYPVRPSVLRWGGGQGVGLYLLPPLTSPSRPLVSLLPSGAVRALRAQNFPLYPSLPFFFHSPSSRPLFSLLPPSSSPSRPLFSLLPPPLTLSAPSTLVACFWVIPYWHVLW